jgi:hypothetical protein
VEWNRITITEANIGLLYQPWMMMMMMSVEQSVELLAGKPKYSEKACPQFRFAHHNSHMT